MILNNCLKMLLVILTLISISNSQERDSINLKIEPDSLSSEDSLITCTIANFSSDTIAIINEFYLEGLTRNTLIYPKPSQYSVNTIFFTTQGFPYFEADGRFPKEYSVLPKFIIIAPASSIIIKINIGYYKELLIYKTWDVSGYFRLAKKKSLESIVSNYSYDKINEYNNSMLVDSNLYFSNGIITDSLKSNKMNNNYDTIMDSIKKAFNILLFAN